MTTSSRKLTMALIGASSLASAAIPAELTWLDGQSVDFISPSDPGQAAVRVTVVSVDAPELDHSATKHPRIAFDSDRGREFVAQVKEMGARIAAAHALPAEFANKYALGLTLQEHVVFGSGSSMGSALEVGFPRGMASPTTQPAAYLVNYRLTVARKTVGAPHTFTCQGRSDGQVSRFSGQDLQMWVPLVRAARNQCVTQLVDKLKADRSL